MGADDVSAIPGGKWEPMALLAMQGFVTTFRRAAERWRGQPGPIEASELGTECGRLVIEADEHGYLPPIPALRERINWHTADGSGDRKPGMHALYVRCPHNLFHDLAGGQFAYVQQVEGRWIAVEDHNRGTARHGGIIPSYWSSTLRLPDHERKALACEWLANLIESRATEARRPDRPSALVAEAPAEDHEAARGRGRGAEWPSPGGRESLAQLALELVTAARTYYEILDRECLRPGLGLNHVEEMLWPAAVALADAIEAASDLMDDPTLPRTFRHPLRQLRDRFHAQMDGWGWREVVGPNREAHIAERRQKFEREVVNPYYDAVLSIDRGGRNQDGKWNAEADEAERRGIRPTMRADEAEAVVRDLLGRLSKTPILGHAIPTVDSEDISPLYQAIRDLSRHATPCAPSPRPAATPEDHEAPDRAAPAQDDDHVAARQGPEHPAIKQACAALGKRGKELINYLARQPNMRATLGEITQAVYSPGTSIFAQNKASATARRQCYRIKEALERDEACPVALVLDDEESGLWSLVILEL